jgi:predicted metal-dependent peptidase
MAFIAPDSLALHWAKVNNKSAMMISYLLRTATGIYLTDEDHPCHSPYACTDDEAIYLNEDWALSAPIMTVCYAIMHEGIHHMFGHCALLHRWRRAGVVHGRPFVEWIAQCALDCVVNDMSNRSGWAGAMPDFAVTSQDITVMHSEDEAYAIYYDLHYKEPPPPPCTLPGEGAMDLLPPSRGAIPDARREQAAAEVIKNLPPENFATGRGTGEGNLHSLLERVRPSGVSWRHAVRRSLRVAAGSDLTSWHRLKPRSWSNGVALPTRRGLSAGKALLVGDTSGSMTNLELETIGGSVADIWAQLNLQELVWLQIDWVVSSATWVKNAQDLRTLLRGTRLQEIHGRGGTDMTKAWAWMKEHDYRPDVAIVMTDMATPFPETTAPAKDVLWVATRPGLTAPAHAGRTVYARIDPT